MLWNIFSPLAYILQFVTIFNLINQMLLCLCQMSKWLQPGQHLIKWFHSVMHSRPHIWVIIFVLAEIWFNNALRPKRKRGLIQVTRPTLSKQGRPYVFLCNFEENFVFLNFFGSILRLEIFWKKSSHFYTFLFNVRVS